MTMSATAGGYSRGLGCVGYQMSKQEFLAWAAQVYPALPRDMHGEYLTWESFRDRKTERNMIE